MRPDTLFACLLRLRKLLRRRRRRRLLLVLLLPPLLLHCYSDDDDDHFCLLPLLSTFLCRSNARTRITDQTAGWMRVDAARRDQKAGLSTCTRESESPFDSACNRNQRILPDRDGRSRLANKLWRRPQCQHQSRYRPTRLAPQHHHRCCRRSPPRPRPHRPNPQSSHSASGASDHYECSHSASAE